ncbi:MAG: hypothetical protein ACHQJ4_07810, partial [Ignavibacteria bacterium]
MCASRGNSPLDTGFYMSKMDIQVYWYGNCDMYLDYVRVDNEVANNLFSIDPLNSEHQKYEQWLQWEGDYVARYDPGNGFHPQWRFYIEEFEFNNIPCIAYVNKKLQYYSSQNGLDTVDMMTCFYWEQFSSHLPLRERGLGYWTASGSKRLDADVVDSLLIKPTGMRQLFAEIYPFTAKKNSGDDIEIPETLPCTTGTCLLADLKPPLTYDNWLQNQLDKTPYPTTGEYGFKIQQDPGWWKYTMKLSNDLSLNYHVPFITMLQTHLNYYPSIEDRREPISEEIKLTTNLAISYGTKGIIYFWFGGDDRNICSDTNFNKGLIDKMDENGPVPRRTNFYGEAKWDSLAALYKLITKWMPYLISFEPSQTHSYSCYNTAERNSLLSNECFTDIASYYPLPFYETCGSPDNPGADGPTNLAYDCINKRYVQAATFKKTGDDQNKYFMIVDRRCAPYFAPGTDQRFPNGENGGRRDIRVRFKPSSFPVYTSWNVIDLKDKHVAATFNKSEGALIDLGWFAPAEGRLYEIIPVLSSGGYLTGDENLSNAEFTCFDSVFTDGYDLSIGNNTKIHFTDTSTFVINGGSLTIGDLQTQGPSGITLDAASGNDFRGITCQNCSLYVYNSNFGNLRSDTDAYVIKTVDCPNVDVR